MNTVNTRKRYAKAFKEEAVRLSYTSGKTVAQQANDLGIAENQLYAWRRAARDRGEQAFPGNGRAHDAELAEWKRRALRAEQERDVLKKALHIFTPNGK
jgi:transposase